MSNNEAYENKFAVFGATASHYDGMTALFGTDNTIMPDPKIGHSERNLYGYMADDMLPLLKERTMELFDADHTIYMLYSDGTEAMVFEREEISGHNGIFGIESGEWVTSKEYADMLKALENGEASKEAALIFGEENLFGIYQLKRGEEMRDYRFEAFDNLQSRGLEVDRSNYELVYTAPLTIRDTLTNLNKIYETFNIIRPGRLVEQQRGFCAATRPPDFTGHSLSVSDVIVTQWRGEVSSHYVDSIGFKELPSFLGNERTSNIERIDDYIDLLREHIDNQVKAGYITANDEKILNGEIDLLNEKMLTVSDLYEKGIPLDVETDTIERLFKEALAQAKSEPEKPPEKPVTIKKPVEAIGVHKDNSTKAGNRGKTSILLQLEKHKAALAQGKEPKKSAPERGKDNRV